MSQLAYYDKRMESLDSEMADTRKLAHDFRDLLRKENHEMDRRMNLLEEQVDHEVEKVTPYFHANTFTADIQQ